MGAILQKCTLPLAVNFYYAPRFAIQHATTAWLQHSSITEIHSREPLLPFTTYLNQLGIPLFLCSSEQ